MKKILLSITALSVAAFSANASISFGGNAIFNNGAGSLYAPGTAFLLVVDTAGDGFDYASNSFLDVNDAISVGSLLGDDDYVLANLGIQGNASITVAAFSGFSFNLGSGVTTGDSFSLAVFGDELAGSATITSAGSFEVFNSATWTIPADGGAWTFQGSGSVPSSQFASLSSATGTTFTIIPEPSTYALVFAGLALVGAVARRRK